MSDLVKPIAEWCAAIVEVIGVGILTLTALYICIYSLIKVFGKDKTENTFHKARQQLGRGILMGLELLVAADIIHTVAVDLSFSTVGVLAIIVLIRTFLSFTLELELTGKWPWQHNSSVKQGQNT
ncbi:putative membrane protein [Catalinimonas alkaloidigena]|uniref:DUF1622 domain-containing protein n=1 Tax=Catalinimonas alkaloidigena TaxID=1075417 RepID=UPI0024073099|nr:DUF1622 domain-containing protein [Catalinimonas alkaloidigena]MDF9799569.1 putative membrane protein [Catalinimonas alkaloidigena]